MMQENRIQRLQYCIFFIMLLAGAGRHAMGQDLKQQFSSWQQQAMQEKIYARTDRNFYMAGEICWFRLYNTDAFFNKPLGISKIAYVELLDKNHKPAVQAKIAMAAGGGSGSLQLPISLPSGKYLLRAYTMWMKNFSPSYFFEKTITVVNARRAVEQDTAIAKARYDIQFFPEGGNLVSGFESRVAFKVVNQLGKGVDCAGVIVNENADTVARYSTLQFGMGSFLFTPQPGHVYRAQLVLPGGRQATQALPPVFSAGYTMQLVNNGKGQLKIGVHTTDSNESPTAVWLLAHTRGAVKAVQSSALSRGYAEFMVDTALLGYGISHFTVFNAARQPVCERLFFKNPGQQLQVSAIPDFAEYESRKKVNIAIQTATAGNNTVPADISVAVYHIDSLGEPDEMDINSYLWLSSDLVGAIQSPAYYFTEGAAAAADNLVLTQGWRRFRWQNILQGKPPAFEFAPEYKGHLLKGKVVNNVDGKPVKEAEAFLSVVGTRSQVKGGFSDDSGWIKFEMDNFYGNGEIIVQAGGTDYNSRHIEMASPFSDKYTESSMPPFALPAGYATALFGRNVSAQVQNGYVGNKMRQQVLPDIDTTAFYYKADKVYMLDDYVRFTTVEEILREYVPEVNVRKRADKFHLPVFDGIRNEYFVVDPLILLDGVPVLDADKIMSYDPLKVRKLEVVSRLYYYGNMMFGGIVNFVTYQGDLTGYELEPSATVIDYETLQLQREFFSPQYPTSEAAAARLPDFRNLLYWSPRVATAKDGKQSVAFYTSDISGRFAAVLQGITADGKTGSKTIFFTVKETPAFAGKK